MKTALTQVKRAFLPSLCFIMLLSLAACKKDQLEEYQTKHSTFQDQTLLQEIKKLGFHDRTIVDVGYAYIVEGDIVFPKDSTNAKSGRKQQWEFGTRVSYSKQANITVRIDGSITNAPGWTDAVHLAITRLNAITNCL